MADLVQQVCDVSGLDEDFVRRALSLPPAFRPLTLFADELYRRQEWEEWYPPEHCGDRCGRCKKAYSLLVTDHCHGCGRTRGTLCRTCNNIEARGGEGRRWDAWRKRCSAGSPYQNRNWDTYQMQPYLCEATDDLAVKLRALQAILEADEFVSRSELLAGGRS